MPTTLPSVPHGGLGYRSDDFRSGDPRQRLIVALDVSTAAAAQKIVAAVGDSALTYKVGMQLYTAEGPQVVRDLVASGRRVFLDLKYHDIPNTVGAAVREAAKLGVSMLTVHASGSGKMLRAAVEAAKATSGVDGARRHGAHQHGRERSGEDWGSRHGRRQRGAAGHDRAGQWMPGSRDLGSRSFDSARGTWGQIRDRHSGRASGRDQRGRSGARRDSGRGHRVGSQPHRGRDGPSRKPRIQRRRRGQFWGRSADNGLSPLARVR